METNSESAGTELFLHIPLEALTASRFQPKSRKADTDLIASVREHGVVTPGLARPTPDGPTAYEVVFGHCRWDASAQAKRDTMPFIVRELDDAQALELQLVENLRRQDLHPLDEAEGYEVLHKEHDYTVEDIAAKIGKSKAYVYARLKLCALTKLGRAAFRIGEIEASVALYLARVPVALQDKALHKLTERHRAEDGPITARDAGWVLREQFMLALKDAPFKLDDILLVPEAGSCKECLKRTGNQRELFADVDGGDVCTDPPCYQGKVDALWQIRKRAAKEKGLEVLDDKRAKEVWTSRYSGTSDGFVELDAPCHKVAGQRKWKALLGKDCPAVTIGRNPHTGAIVELVEVSAATKVLRTKGLIDKKDRDEPAPKSKDETAAAKVGRALREKVATEALGAIATAAEKPIGAAGWQLLIERLLDICYGDIALAAERRGLTSDDMDEAVKKMTAAQLQGLMAELLMGEGLVDHYTDFDGDKELPAACKTFGVDLKAIEKRIAAAVVAGEKAEAEKPAKAKAPKKGKKK